MKKGAFFPEKVTSLKITPVSECAHFIVIGVCYNYHHLEKKNEKKKKHAIIYYYPDKCSAVCGVIHVKILISEEKIYELDNPQKM